MHVTVNGTRLFFDVEGASLVPDGPAMRQRPTVLLLHGGPGFDHSIYRPAYAALADVAQLVYLDHRGNGRSDPDEPTNWNLALWGDDVRGFCEALGIKRPIVLGVSFGGMVAMSYATRHPDHPAKLILVSTEAKGTSYRERRVELFHELGGPEVGALAHRRFIERQTDPKTLAAWVRLAMPFYTRRRPNPDVAARGILRAEVLRWFTRPGGEGQSFDLFPVLHRVACPTLVVGGEDDPMTPIESQADIVSALRPGIARFERFAGCGHGVVADAEHRAMTLFRDFITEAAS